MTHDELLDRINVLGHTSSWAALRAVVELHKPFELQSGITICDVACNDYGGYAEPYPCSTIKAIQKELL